MRHASATDEIRAAAAAYALGALDADAARELHDHVAAGCTVCRDEIAAFDAVADDLAIAVTPVEPPASLRARMLADVDNEAPHDHGDAAITAPAPAAEGFLFLLGGEGGWEALGPGVSVRNLGSNPATRSRSFVIRMTPGSALPRHDHAGVEHCYVLDGDVEAAGRRLHAGDYHLAPPGTTHDQLRTEGGCTFLIVECRV